jgi:hypothetical protein
MAQLYPPPSGQPRRSRCICSALILPGYVQTDGKETPWDIDGPSMRKPQQSTLSLLFPTEVLGVHPRTQVITASPGTENRHTAASNTRHHCLSTHIRHESHVQALLTQQQKAHQHQCYFDPKHTISVSSSTAPHHTTPACFECMLCDTNADTHTLCCHKAASTSQHHSFPTHIRHESQAQPLLTQQQKAHQQQRDSIQQDITRIR